jgi:AcrR family transcriptional regulator
MYQMVQLAMARSQARDRLLAAAVGHATQHGIADLSLRELAAAIGTSHRMLLYHFGSREGLLAAVASAVDAAQREALPVTVQDALRQWESITDPRSSPMERLFFELYVHALLGRPGTEGFLEASVEPWFAPIAAALVKAGVDEAAAAAEARLSLAVARGLILDLLATGDRDGVTQAYERYLDHLNLR